MCNKFILSLIAAMLTLTAAQNTLATPDQIEQLVPISADKPGPVLPIQHWTTANGAEVYFVPEHQLPILDVEILFHAGSAQDSNNFGLANFTNSMIGQGAENLTADQIADRFDSLGAQFSTNCSRDAAEVSLRTLTEPEVMDSALDTFTKVLTQPNFSTKSFSRVKNQLLQAILQEQQTPSDLADQAFYNAVYGNYPYAHDPIGKAATIQRLAPSALISFYRQYYVGANATIAIVGDISQEQAVKLAKQLVGGLPTGKTAAPLPTPVYAPTQKTIQVAYPSTQTFVRIGELGISRNNPQYFPLYVGNYVLGGGVLVSRLFKEVRDKRGLSYNVGSYFIPMQENGPFVASLQSRSNKSSEAIQVTQEVIGDFIKNGPTDNELKAAKQNIIGGFPLLLSGNNNLVDLVATMAFYKLPLNYLDTYRANVSAVTKDDIKKAFAQQLNPQNMVVVTVGPTHDPAS